MRCVLSQKRLSKAFVHFCEGKEMLWSNPVDKDLSGGENYLLFKLRPPKQIYCSNRYYTNLYSEFKFDIYSKLNVLYRFKITYWSRAPSAAYSCDRQETYVIKLNLLCNIEWCSCPNLVPKERGPWERGWK